MNWFNDNKYSKYYFMIVSKAKDRVNLSGTFEKHHIKPKSFDGSNIKENIVKMTLREHFICHRLLVKMVDGIFKRKMNYALYRMQRNSKYADSCININSRTYELLRIKFIEEQKKHAVEVKDKMIATLRLTLSTPEAHQKKRDAALKSSTAVVNAKKSESAKKRKWSPEVKQKMAETRRQKFANDYEYREKILAGLRSIRQRTHSVEERKVRSESMKGIIRGPYRKRVPIAPFSLEF